MPTAPAGASRCDLANAFTAYMSDMGSGGFRIQGRGAAEGQAGGPSMTPGRGPTNRRDVGIAVLAIAVVIGAVVLLATLG